MLNQFRDRITLKSIVLRAALPAAAHRATPISAAAALDIKIRINLPPLRLRKLRSPHSLDRFVA